MIGDALLSILYIAVYIRITDVELSVSELVDKSKPIAYIVLAIVLYCTVIGLGEFLRPII